MKKLIFVLSSVSIMTAFIAFTYKPPEYKYILTEGQMMIMYNTNTQVKQILPTSQAPAIQVTQLNYAIDSIQRVLAIQYNNFHPDSTASKKK